MRLAFVAGPYAAPTPEGIEKNIQRALRAGKEAADQGFAVIVPHATGAALYGPEEGPDAKLSRARALEAGRSIAHSVGADGGVLFVIARADRTLTEGTTMELIAYVKGCNEASIPPEIRFY